MNEKGMNEQYVDRLHALIIPTLRLPIMVPSSLTAEIMFVPKINPMPFSEPWVLGLAAWRSLAIPIISIECLLGDTQPPIPHEQCKLVVFQPLQGRSEWDFFSILASGDPQPYTVGSTADLVPASSPVNSPYVGATVKIEQSSVIIPNMDAIYSTFYP